MNAPAMDAETYLRGQIRDVERRAAKAVVAGNIRLANECYRECRKARRCLQDMGVTPGSKKGPGHFHVTMKNPGEKIDAGNLRGG